MQLRGIRRAFVAALITFFVCLTPAHAQGVATVAGLRQALVDAIDRLDTALSNQAGNVKSVGESLTANARSLLSDIDSRLGDKLKYTFQQLDDSEKKLFGDAFKKVNYVECSPNGSKTMSQECKDAGVESYPT